MYYPNQDISENEEKLLKAHWDNRNKLDGLHPGKWEQIDLDIKNKLQLALESRKWESLYFHVRNNTVINSMKVNLCNSKFRYYICTLMHTQIM